MNIYRKCLTLVLVLALASVVQASPNPDGNPECSELLDVGLVIDRSGSMAGSRITAAKDGSKAFLDKLDPDDQSGLVSFASASTLDKSLDFNHAGTKSAVNALSAGGGTNMEPAIDQSAGDIDANQRTTARQVMVVLTDGYSAPDPVAAADRAKLRDIEVYVIGVGDNVNEPELKAVASDPDSKYYHHARTDADVEAAYDSVFEEIQCDPPPECSDGLDIGLVIDRSGSMAGTRIQAAKDGSKSFLDRLGPDDQSGLVSFASGTTLDKSLDFNHAGTKAAVDALSAGGGTNMEPAIDQSRSDIQANDRPAARNVMVVLTDGYSAPDPVAAADRARLADIEVYVIAVGDSVNEPELRAVANDPDSKYYHHARTDAEVAFAYDSVFGEIDCDPDPPCWEVMDIDFAVDTSARVDPVTLDVTVDELARLTDYLQWDERSGVTVFDDGSAATIKWIDEDHVATGHALRSLSPLDVQIASEHQTSVGLGADGTSLTQGILAAIESFQETQRIGARQVLVLAVTSEPQSLAGAIDAATYAREQGIYVYLLGNGLRQPGWDEIAPDRVYIAPTVLDIRPVLTDLALDIRCVDPPEPPVCQDWDSLVADGIGTDDFQTDVKVERVEPLPGVYVEEINPPPHVCVERVRTPEPQHPKGTQPA